MSAFTRRQILKTLSLGGLSLYLNPTQALGGSVARKRGFVLYIHCGSWDGWSSGLLQGHGTYSNGGILMANWPKGIFTNGAFANSVNPHINRAFVEGNLVFNNYSRVAKEIAEHMCFCVGNSQSAGHPTAASYQATGTPETSPQSGWIGGFAQAMADANNASSLIVGNPASRVMTTMAETFRVARIQADSRAQFLTAYQDSEGVPTDANAAQFEQLSRNLFAGQHVRGKVDSQLKFSYNTFLSNLTSKVEDLNETSPAFLELKQQLSVDKVRGLIDSTLGSQNDGGFVHLTDPNQNMLNQPFMDQLMLAGLLAKTGLAHGMGIGHHDDDLHVPGALGSSVLTARRASVFWAQIRLFWEWVVANDMQDDFMIVISHDFSRSPYNSYLSPNITLQVEGVNQTFQSPGTDHSLTMGMVFINGKVPAASRIGGVGEGNTPLSSVDFSGTPVNKSRAFTSDELVGSMLIRCFPDLFKDHASLKKYWPKMRAPIDWISSP